MKEVKTKLETSTAFTKIADDCFVMEIENVGCIVKSGEAMVFVPQAKLIDNKLTT